MAKEVRDSVLPPCPHCDRCSEGPEIKTCTPTQLGVGTFVGLVVHDFGGKVEVSSSNRF